MKKVVRLIVILLLIQTGLTSCQQRTNTPVSVEKDSNGIPLKHKETLDLEFAELFQVDYYEGGYTLLTVNNDTQIFVIPEGGKVPSGLDSKIIVLERPIKNIYLVATAVMDMFDNLDSLDTIRLSGQKEDGWYIQNAKKYIREGKILYAGKYNKPDYELIVSEGCSLAIENTMVLHSPDVIEKLNEFNVPVVIDDSSGEKHPLGRVEWIKFYGALLGKEELADNLFKQQMDIFNQIIAEEKLNKTVAFFYIASNGMVQIRRPSDYVPKMIDFAGGKYIFDQLEVEDSKRSTMMIQMEDFYHVARNADYLVYNSTIDGGIENIEQLIQKNELLKDFKAVKEGNVWCTTNDMYQQSMSIGYLIEDMHNMMTQDKEADMRYLTHVE